MKCQDLVPFSDIIFYPQHHYR